MASNLFVNTSWVSQKILVQLLNKLTCTEYFNRDWEPEFKREFAPGSQIQVKFPQRMTTTLGMGYQPQAINRIATTLNLDTWIQCSFEWDDYEAAVRLERSERELEENYFSPAGEALAQAYDSQAANWARIYTSTIVGQLGTDPNTVATYYAARAALKVRACPGNKRAMLISSSMMASIGGAITNIFQPPDEISKTFKEGALGRLAGFNFFESNSLYTHTAGTWASTVTVNGANQSGTSLAITCTAGDTFNQGDKFSIANVNFVNPMTRRYPGPKAVETFTVTTALTGVGGGNPADVLTILPAIFGPGSQYQNVDALPANGANLTLFPGTTSPNGKSGTVGLGISPFAFGLAACELYMPKAVETGGAATDPDSHISIRKVKAWDPQRSMLVNRMDSLCGFGNFYQDAGAVAVLGA